MDLQRMGWVEGGLLGLDWYGATQGQVAGPCEGENKPSLSIKCGNFMSVWVFLGFSRTTLLYGFGQLVANNRIVKKPSVNIEQFTVYP
jgi:hypothetical protein